jgi:hypothetical protein
MKHFFLILLFFLSSTLGFSQDRRTVKFVDEYLNVGFREIHGVKQPIAKWSSDIKTLKYKIVGEFQYMNEKNWDKYLLGIEELTGIKLIRTYQDDFKILIFFGEIDDYLEFSNNDIPFNIANKFSTWNNRKYHSDYSLKSTSFCIVPAKIKDGNKGIFWLKRGILHGFGLLGEIEYESSIFYKYLTATNTRLSRKDKRYIKLHYNQAIKPGTNYGEVKQTLLNLSNIKELSKERL